MTSGCTAQACNLRIIMPTCAKPVYEVISISVDSEKSHQKFIEKNNLLPDCRHRQEAGRTIRSMGRKSMYGRKYMGTFRTTFIINEEGIVERIITPKEAKDHAAQIL